VRFHRSLGFVFVLSACTSEEEPPPPTATDLPCEIDQILANNCRSCHVDPPAVGAPMPLVDHADFTAQAVSDPSKTVAELVRARIFDQERPMPPVGTMSDADRDALAAWIDGGTATGTCGPSNPPAGPSGPEHLPCEASHTFVAHAAGSTDRYEVPVAADNLYQCFTFRSPFADGMQATAWAPIIDDERVVHHWILYRTASALPDGGVERCNMPADATFVAGWAPGGGNWVMPRDVGLELPSPSESLILQVHYWNAAGHTDALDASGVAFCTTDTPRTHEAGVFTLGKAPFSIPPRASGYEVSGTCPSWATRLLTQPVQVLGSFPHMHQYGTRFETSVRRANGSTESLVRIDRWNFEDQRFYAHEPQFTVMPGDEITTTCTYDNPTASPVAFGERTEDEMCFNFALIYPIGPFTGQRQCGVL
jgi:hypothetical protein